MKAKEVGDKLLAAFNTPTGIPWAMVNFARFVVYVQWNPINMETMQRDMP